MAAPGGEYRETLGRPGDSATVYLAGTLTLATLYTDVNETTAAPNPTVLDSFGALLFFADVGAYDVLVNGALIRAEVTAHVGTYAPTKGPIAPAKPAQTVGNAVTVMPGNQNAGYLSIVSDTFYNGPASPGIRKLPDGRYLMVYRRATSHSSAKGSIYGRLLTISTDGQWTVGAAFLLVTDATYDVRDAQLCIDASGRALMTYFKENASDATIGTSSGGMGCWVKILPAAAEPSVSANWGAEISMNDGWNSRAASSGPIAYVPGGDGTLYLPIYGRNGNETHDSAAVIRSTDGGATWGNKVIVANGEADNRVYGECTLTWMPTRNTFLFQTRCTPEQSIYRCFSQLGSLNAYTAPTKAYAGNSSPRTFRAADGRVVTLVRGTDGTQSGAGVSALINHAGRTMYIASDDEGVTWGQMMVLDTVTAGCQYGDFVEPQPGLIGAFYCMESAGDQTQAAIRFRWIATRAAFTPTGKVLARGVSVVEGDLEAHGQSRIAHFATSDARRPSWDVEQVLNADGISYRSALRFYDPWTATLIMEIDPLIGLSMLSKTVTEAANLLSVGESTYPRDRQQALSNSMTSGAVRFSYFTARKTETINTLRSIVGTPTSGTAPTIVRKGVYSVAANGDLTLIASTPNDVTLFNAGGNPSKALSAPWNKVQGTRYAIGDLVVTTGTTAQLGGISTAGGVSAEAALAPRLAASLTAQTDLPAGPVADSSLTASVIMLYTAMVP